MPTSGAEGRGWVYNRVSDTITPTIVDVGAGEGTYSTLCRHLRLDARWIGVEVHQPYVDRFMLGQKYDDIVVADIREWQPVIGEYTILFGDVLEHMPKQDAVEVLNWHMRHADHVMVSVPIVYSPQGECEGNPWEEHHHHWHFEEMLALLPGCEAWRGNMLGRFWWTRDGVE